MRNKHIAFREPCIKMYEIVPTQSKYASLRNYCHQTYITRQFSLINDLPRLDLMQ